MLNSQQFVLTIQHTSSIVKAIWTSSVAWRPGLGLICRPYLFERADRRCSEPTLIEREADGLQLVLASALAQTPKDS
jgi:hypothetical protein